MGAANGFLGARLWLTIRSPVVAPPQRAASFDQLVSGGEQRLRDGQAERFGGLKVDGQYELCWKFDRQIVSLGTFQNPVNVVGGSLIAANASIP